MNVMNSFNLPKIDQEQALNLCKFFIRSQQNLFLMGRRGTGKTHLAIQAALDLGLKINYINLSVIERADLAGYPDMNVPGDVIVFKSPYFLPPLEPDKEPDSIILFDEVDKASPEITAPLLEILQFRKINGKPINAVNCILTGNLINEGANSYPISSALLDRGAKFILDFNFERWVDWAKTNNIHDLVLGFLRHNSDLACGKIDDSSFASPSPRAWTLASDALNKAKDLKIADIDTIVQIVSGFVGEEVGLRFKIWYEYYRQYESNIMSVVETGDPRLDLATLHKTELIIFIIGVCFAVKQRVLQDINHKQDFCRSLENLCKFFNNFKIEKELQIMGLYNSFDFDMITKKKLYQCTSFFDLFSKLNESVTLKK